MTRGSADTSSDIRTWMRSPRDPTTPHPEISWPGTTSHRSASPHYGDWVISLPPAHLSARPFSFAGLPARSTSRPSSLTTRRPVSPPTSQPTCRPVPRPLLPGPPALRPFSALPVSSRSTLSARPFVGQPSLSQSSLDLLAPDPLTRPLPARRLPDRPLGGRPVPRPPDGTRSGPVGRGRTAGAGCFERDGPRFQSDPHIRIGSPRRPGSPRANTGKQPLHAFRSSAPSCPWALRPRPIRLPTPSRRLTAPHPISLSQHRALVRAGPQPDSLGVTTASSTRPHLPATKCPARNRGELGPLHDIHHGPPSDRALPSTRPGDVRARQRPEHPQPPPREGTEARASASDRCFT